jgi:exopolysaccharide biosynthesis polyprenyl glycosylphosphotransferase
VIESGNRPDVSASLLTPLGAARLDDAFAVRASIGWKRRYAALLIIADVLSAAAAVALIHAFSLDGLHPRTELAYFGGSAWGILFLLGALFASGCYEQRHLSTPVEEYRRLFRATGAVLFVSALYAVLIHMMVPRRVVLIDIPLVLAMLALGRTIVRRIVNIQRERGNWSERVLVVGATPAVDDLIRSVRRRPFAGLTVVAACVPDGGRAGGVDIDVPVLGGWDDAVTVADAVDADIVVLAGAGRGPRAVRDMAWQLQSAGRHLVTALELADISSSRIHLRPVDGLPLAWVDHPEFSGGRRMVKRAVDVLLAGTALLLLSPFLLLIGLLIRATSAGPALFKQTRTGKDGQTFRVWKFRTMVNDAEARLHELADLNEADNLLYFKVRNDPRITRVGGWLRRFSLDELPQLVNVLHGSMSLVGPRPLPGEIEEDVTAYHRRLRVKPGLTGLWQVSGRSELTTDDALRLDLYYVENWTLGLDLAIMARTVWAVARSRGAY